MATPNGTSSPSPSASLTSLAGVSEQQSLICSVIPPMLFDNHKGQAGRIGILGGSIEYAGAAFYAAMAALKMGADLAYVFCPSSAAVPIRSYSPEVMVFPVLDAPNALDCLRNDYLPRLHSLVIGPGLGRSEKLLDLLSGVVSKARELKLPVVIDADGLYFVTLKPELVRGYQRVILTPNLPEMERLHSAVLGYPAPEDRHAGVQALARALGYVTVLVKGKDDVISDGKSCVQCREQGCPRRCGGQGDVLAGMVGTFSHWSHTASGTDYPQSSSKHSPTLIAALGGAMLTRRCARQAFRKCSRSMLTTDILKEVRTSFAALFPVD